MLPTPVAKIFSYKKEGAASWGAPAAGGAGAQILRRVEGVFTTEADTFESDEVTPTFQTTDVQVGQQRARGSLRGRFSGKTYQDFIAAFCRQAFQAAPTTGALITVTAAVASPQYVRAAGSFITDGFRVGQVVKWTGWAAPAAANNDRYFLITALTALQMTGVHLDATAVIAKAAGDNVTCTLAGKQTWIPQSGHTTELFTFEDYHPDMTVTESEVFYNMFGSSLAIAQDPKGYMGMDFGFMGRAQQNSSGAPYFVGPTAITSTRLHNLLDGALYLGGTKVADVTGLTLNLDQQAELAPATYGTRYPGGVAPGRIKIGGSLAALWTDKTLRDNFITRTKFALIGVSRAAALAQSDTAVIVLPSVTLTSADKSDGQTGFVSRNYNLMADNNVAGSGADQSSFSFQDTQAT